MKRLDQAIEAVEAALALLKTAKDTQHTQKKQAMTTIIRAYSKLTMAEEHLDGAHDQLRSRPDSLLETIK